MDTQPLVRRPPPEPPCHGVIILILLRLLITTLAVNLSFNQRPKPFDARATPQSKTSTAYRERAY